MSFLNLFVLPKLFCLVDFFMLKKTHILYRSNPLTSYIIKRKRPIKKKEKNKLKVIKHEVITNKYEAM